MQLGDLGDGERRGVRGQDRVGAREAVELGEELSLRLQLLDDGLDDEVTACEVVELCRQSQAGQCRVSLVLREALLLDSPAHVAVDRRATRSASSADTSRPMVSWPAVTLICAMPAPIVPSPTTPTFTAAILWKKARRPPVLLV